MYGSAEVMRMRAMGLAEEPEGSGPYRPGRSKPRPLPLAFPMVKVHLRPRKRPPPMSRPQQLGGVSRHERVQLAGRPDRLRAHGGLGLRLVRAAVRRDVDQGP